MGIYLHNMEMPKERESFTVTIKYNGLVFDTETMIQVAEAHEVPPHGRLVDADALEDELGRFCDDNWVYNTLHHAPTIIPAEEGDYS